jgi:anti-anti-sigma factor
MEFKKSYLKDWLVLEIPEEINYECNLALKKEIEKSCEQGERSISLDLRKVSFIGSSTLGIFCFAQKHLDNAAGKFCLIGPNEIITSVLKDMGITKIVKVVGDTSDL